MSGRKTQADAFRDLARLVESKDDHYADASIYDISDSRVNTGGTHAGFLKYKSLIGVKERNGYMHLGKVVVYNEESSPRGDVDLRNRIYLLLQLADGIPTSQLQTLVEDIQ